MAKFNLPIERADISGKNMAMIPKHLKQMFGYQNATQTLQIYILTQKFCPGKKFNA